MAEDRLAREGKSLSENSVLVITVIEAQNVEFDHSKVTVRAGDREQTTGYSDSSQPQFNQQFTFNGLSLNDNVEVILTSGENELSSLKGVQPVGEMQDQKIHDKWLPLGSDSGQRSNARAHLQFQYTYQKSKLCQEAIDTWREHIRVLTMKNEANENDLNQMYNRLDFLESIAKKPNYFRDIKPVDKLVSDVASSGNLRAQVRGSAPQAPAPTVQRPAAGGDGGGHRGAVRAGVQVPHVH